mgnify:FL=1
MVIGESIMKELINKPLTLEEYLKSYQALIKYFIRLRLAKASKQFVRLSHDDIFQDVCILLMEYMRQHPDRNIKAEVLRQYVNWQVNRMERKEKKSPIMNVSSMGGLERVPSTLSEPDEEESQSFYEDCMDFVSKKYPSDLNQQIFYLRYHLNLPFKEIDNRLDITDGNARKKYYKMIRDVKKFANKHELIDKIH